MANKRTLKKYVDALAAAVSEDMLIARYNVEGINADAVDSAISKILAGAEFAKKRSNIFFDRGVKAFDSYKEYRTEKERFFRALFTKIITEYSETIDEAIKEFNAAVPADVKAKNVEA